MNIESIIAAASRPSPFEPSLLSIWTDPWISQRLLEAHLDDSTDAASRAPAQRERALAWIEGYLPRPGMRILDLGCGPGLYANELARRGHSVVGIDLNANSARHARAAAVAAGLQVDYRVGSYLADEIGSGYDLAMMIYCDFGALAPRAAELLLDRVRAALAPGGVFVFDILGPSFASSAPSLSWRASAGPGFWSRFPHLALEETLAYPDAACFARQTIVCVEGAEPAIYRTWDRYFGEAETAALLARAGFQTIRIASGIVAKNDFASSDVLFVAART